MSLDIEKALPFTTPLPPKYTFCAHGETPCRDCIIRWDLEDRARIRHELRIERRRRNDSCDGPGIIIAIPAIMLTAIVFFFDLLVGSKDMFDHDDVQWWIKQ